MIDKAEEHAIPLPSALIFYAKQPDLLQKRLHLQYIVGAAVDHLLGEGKYLGIRMLAAVHVFISQDHSSGISLDHHSGNFRIDISEAKLPPGCGYCHKFCRRINIPYIPAAACGNTVGVCFDLIVFPKLGLQIQPQCMLHIRPQSRANADLTHLRGFYNGGKQFLIIVHVYHLGIIICRIASVYAQLYKFSIKWLVRKVIAMCAIAGVFRLDLTEKAQRKMLNTMVRRGPDEEGVLRRREAVLLHRRLSVIDPEGGQQPMALEYGGKEYCIVYNGELYNTPELRKELLALGHVFKDHSDTEVVLHSFAQFGPGCLDKFNGIFAFAVYVPQEDRLFLARDRMGVKPLFYARVGNGLVFASEIKTILAYPGFTPVLDEQGACELLLLGPGRTPGSGVLQGIYEIEPGCCGEVSDALRIRRYWRLIDREHTHGFEETVEHVSFLVRDAIRRQLVSDVPLGTFLSGGLDSSIISAVAAQEYSCQGKRLDTFSIDYDQSEKYFTPNKFQPTCDNDYIGIMADHIHAKRHTTVLTPQQLSDALEEATDARDLPGMADVDFSLLQFCREIRKHVTVALSGECADEIFGGYPWFRDPKVRAVDGFPWAQNTAQRAAFLSPELAQKVDAYAFVSDRYRQTLLETDVLPGTSPQEKRMKEMVNLNYRWFMQTLLDRKDRMSMYSGLEVRVPFCDYRIAEYLYGVPWEFKDWQGREKGLLRKAVEDLLPESILYRKKSPYPKTYDPQYLRLMEARLQDLLQRKDAPIFALVEPEALHLLLTMDHPWPWYGQLMRRPQTIAYMLQLNYWLASLGVSIRF